MDIRDGRPGGADRHEARYKGVLSFMVEDQTHYARVAALSIAHGAALVKLLRAHGQTGHADNVEAALDEFVEIVSDEVGQQILTQAMNWVSEASWGTDMAVSKDTTTH